MKEVHRDGKRKKEGVDRGGSCDCKGGDIGSRRLLEANI